VFPIGRAIAPLANVRSANKTFFTP